MASPNKPDNSQIWDRCVENGIVKTGYGLLAGAAASFLLFRRSTECSHPWHS